MESLAQSIPHTRSCQIDHILGIDQLCPKTLAMSCIHNLDRIHRRMDQCILVPCIPALAPVSHKLQWILVVQQCKQLDVASSTDSLVEESLVGWLVLASLVDWLALADSLVLASLAPSTRLALVSWSSSS